MALLQNSIEKLGRFNYATWARDVKYLLIEKNCWDIVNKTEVEPSCDGAKDADLIQFNKDVKDFKTRSRTALSIIYLNIESEFKPLIESCDEAVAAWDLLKRHYQPDNRSRHMALFSELLACRLGPDEGIDLFSARLKRISLQLKSINQPLPEVYLAFQLIRYLPDEYEPAVQNILRWDEAEFKYETILATLITEESRLRLRELDRMDHWTPETQFTRSRPVYRNYERCYNSQQQNRKPRKETSPRPFNPTRYRNLNGHSSRRRSNSDEARNRTDSRRIQRRKSSERYRISKSRDSSHKGRSGTFSYLTQASFTNSDDSKKSWVFDSAASHHFCKSKNLFLDFKPKHEIMYVATENITYPIEGVGSVKLNFGSKCLILNNVMYAPKLRKNLISGSQLDIKGYTFSGGGGLVKLKRNNKTIFLAKLNNGIYYVYPSNSNSKSKTIKYQAAHSKVEELNKWHRRFAHISQELIENTSKNRSVRGLPQLCHAKIQCEPCKLSKQKRVSFKPINKIRSKRPLELLMMDTWGPSQHKGKRGERYFLSIIDDFSRKTAIYPMRNKSEVFRVFRQHVTRAERFLNLKLNAIRTDNGTEFKNNQFFQFCESNGIKHEFTNIYTPEQNGACERFNQTILNGIRTVLNESKLNNSFWAEAALYFTYTWNRICHKDQTHTPFELYGGNQPSVKHLKPFGTPVYVGTPKQTRSKFDARARKGILIGYAFSTKGYRIWLPDDQKIIETANLIFKDEDKGNSRGSEFEGAVLGTIPSNPPQDQNSKNSYVWIPSSETPESSSSDEEEIIKSSREVAESAPLKIATWIRKPIPRPDGSRTDIYYEQGKSMRLRSENDIIRYCKKNHIKYEPALFDFKGKNKYEGVVKGSEGSSSSKNLDITDSDEPQEIESEYTESEYTDAE